MPISRTSQVSPVKTASDRKGQGFGAGIFLLLFLSLAVFSRLYGGQEPRVKSDRGYAYSNEVVAGVPWSIHVLKIERGHPELELQTTLGGGLTLGMGNVSEQVKSIRPEQGKPIAAINGDFYHDSREITGDPDGLQIRWGELVSAPNAKRSCIWIDASGNPHCALVTSQLKVTWPNGLTTPMGLNEERARDAAVLYTSVIGSSTRTARGVDLVLTNHEGSEWLPLKPGRTYTAQVSQVVERGNAPLGPGVMVLSVGSELAARIPRINARDILRLSTATNPDLNGAKMGIGGGPALIADGKAVRWSDSFGRHPRAAVGWNKEHFFLVEVDGRQRNLSLGMTVSELANWMVKLGCTEALNMDGGGSATFWVLGAVMNSPSEGRERPAANALVLMQKPADGKNKGALTGGK